MAISGKSAIVPTTCTITLYQGGRFQYDVGDRNDADADPMLDVSRWPDPMALKYEGRVVGEVRNIRREENRIVGEMTLTDDPFADKERTLNLRDDDFQVAVEPSRNEGEA